MNETEIEHEIVKLHCQLDRFRAKLIALSNKMCDSNYKQPFKYGEIIEVTNCENWKSVYLARFSEMINDTDDKTLLYRDTHAVAWRHARKLKA